MSFSFSSSAQFYPVKIYTCLCKFLVFDCLHSKCRQMRQCAWTAGFPWVVIRSANATRVYCVSWRTAGCYRLCPPWSVFNSFLLFYACRGSFWLVTQSLPRRKACVTSYFVLPRDKINHRYRWWAANSTDWIFVRFLQYRFEQFFLFNLSISRKWLLLDTLRVLVLWIRMLDDPQN